MAWIIDVDHIADEDIEAPSNLNAVGLTGPRAATEKDLEKLRAGEGEKFRLLDDDLEVYYEGRMLKQEDSEHGQDEDPEQYEFGPVDNFGAPNAGAVHQQYWDKEDNDWRML